MRIVHLAIRCFRGIRELDWSITSDTVCLIGSGDSTKTTILDAIDLAIGPRTSIAINDSDFFGCSPNTPIEITATLIDLPEQLLTFGRYGDHVRGWSPASGIIDEPDDKCEAKALSIRLRVDHQLDPEWTVVTARNLPDGHTLSYREREKLGFTRLGTYADWHLTWAKNSALTRMSSPASSARSVLALSARAARYAFTSDSVSELDTTCHDIQSKASLL